MREYTEQDKERILGQEMEVSPIVERRLEEVYGKIKSQGQTVTKKKRPFYRNWYVGGVAAAAAACVIGVSNPVVAAKLPIIGNIFSMVSDRADFGGDFGKVGTPLTSISQNKESYSSYSDGMRVTLSEAYCNEKALYVTVELEADEPFAKEIGEDALGNKSLELIGTAAYSYQPTEQDVFSYVRGRFVDDKTYIGMFRVDLDDTRMDYTKYQEAWESLSEEEQENLTDEEMKAYDSLISSVEIPDEFQVHFEFSHVLGDKAEPISIEEAAGVTPKTEAEVNQMSDEEWSAYMKELENLVPDYNSFPSQYTDYSFEGPYEFDLTLTVDHKDTVTIPVDKESDDYHISSVTKTPFELVVDEANLDAPSYQEDNCILIAVDADGKRLDNGNSGGSMNSYQVKDRNLSKVDFYLISWEQFENLEIKGDYYYTHNADENGKPLTELLAENCRYHREVSFS